MNRRPSIFCDWFRKGSVSCEPIKGKSTVVRSWLQQLYETWRMPFHCLLLYLSFIFIFWLVCPFWPFSCNVSRALERKVKGKYVLYVSLFSLTLWYWKTSLCALPWGRQFLALSAFFSWPVILCVVLRPPDLSHPTLACMLVLFCSAHFWQSC